MGDGSELLFVLSSRSFSAFIFFGFFDLATCVSIEKGKRGRRTDEREGGKSIRSLCFFALSQPGPKQKRVPTIYSMDSRFLEFLGFTTVAEAEGIPVWFGNLVKRKRHGRTLVNDNNWPPKYVACILRMGLLRSNMTFLVPVGTRKT